jgi:hypothetical protein
VYLGHRTDLVLFGPPGLALLGFILAIIGDIRSRRTANRPAMTEPQAESYTPPDPYDVAPTSFRGSTAAIAPLSARDPLDGISERDYAPSRLNGRTDRKSAPQPTPTPTFRELDEEEEEDEPSLLRRVGGGITNLLSFGLYAAAAASVLLVIYNLYQRDNGTALVTNPTPKATPSVAEAAPTPTPSSSIQPAAPAPVVVVTPPPVSSSAPPPAAISTALATPAAPSLQSVEPMRVVGEPAPEDAVPATSSAPPPSSAVQPAPSVQPSSEPVAVANAAPLPEPDFVDSAKTAPIPAVMSPELAAARRAGTFDNARPDSFAVAPVFSGSDI